MVIMVGQPMMPYFVNTHTAACPSLFWASLEPSIQASTFLVSHSGGDVICTFCSGSDHSAKDCALGYTASIPASTSHSARAS